MSGGDYKDNSYIAVVVLIVMLVVIICTQCSTSPIQIHWSSTIEIHQSDSLESSEGLKIDELVPVQDGTRVEK